MCIDDKKIQRHGKRIAVAFIMILGICGVFSTPVYAQSTAQPALPQSQNPAADTALAPMDAGVAPPEVTVPEGDPAVTQDSTALTSKETATLDNVEKSVSSHIALDPNAALPKDIKTLFYTAWQYALLVEARQSFKTHPAGGGSDTKSPGPREISLGGISYLNAKSWTVWLNSQRIKPDAFPPQIMSFQVARDHVDLKWFDNVSNLIYPIRLHPHERFNLDSRIFLPGAGISTPSSANAATPATTTPGT